MLVLRTRRPFFRSRPGTLLLVTSLVVAVVTVAAPFSPAAPVLGFVPLPFSMLAALAAITAVYVAVTEAGKVWFYRRHPAGTGAQRPRPHRSRRPAFG
jgi:Mg2+-importing ATPase